MKCHPTQTTKHPTCGPQCFVAYVTLTDALGMFSSLLELHLIINRMYEQCFQMVSHRRMHSPQVRKWQQEAAFQKGVKSGSQTGLTTACVNTSQSHTQKGDMQPLHWRGQGLPAGCCNTRCQNELWAQRLKVWVEYMEKRVLENPVWCHLGGPL